MIGFIVVILAPNVSTLDYKSMSMVVVASFFALSVLGTIFSSMRAGLL